MSDNVVVIAGERLARYGFGDGHPFGQDRLAAFLREFGARALDRKVRVLEPRDAREEELLAFHTASYLEFVRERSTSGQGYLDAGDTPAFRGVYEAASRVVGATLTATEGIMAGDFRHAFVPIAGLHHAARDHAAGFCVFNDCGVAIELLRSRFGLARVAYVDIDAHHGDGVFYAFESDAAVIFADLHEDGRYLYPGTGAVEETGRGAVAARCGRLRVLGRVAARHRAPRALRARIHHSPVRRGQHRRRSPDAPAPDAARPCPGGERPCGSRGEARPWARPRPGRWRI
jgi:acetoin utilization protein AcuC